MTPLEISPIDKVKLNECIEPDNHKNVHSLLSSAFWSVWSDQNWIGAKRSLPMQNTREICLQPSIYIYWYTCYTLGFHQFILLIFPNFRAVVPSGLVPSPASQPEPRQSAWHGLHLRGQGHWRLLRWCRGRLSALPRLCAGLRVWGEFHSLIN